MTLFPNTTYRIQFHQGFTLENFRGIIPYLQKLGVATVYASPIFSAVPGSTHGYDGVNPNEVNPEIGTVEELKQIVASLKADGITWLQDIVPNHMAFHPKNVWLFDFLEKGPLSRYAGFFDQSVSSGVYQGKIMLPILGEALEDAIAENKITMELEGGRLMLAYGDQQFPASPESYLTFLDTAGDDRPSLRILADEIRNVMAAEEPVQLTTAWSEILMQLKSLTDDSMTADWMTHRLEELMGDRDVFQTFLSRQHYVFAHWQDTNSDINFRRFFTVNGLIGLNIHRPEVFSAFHELIGELSAEGLLCGLRVDHVDGLYEPTRYLQELRALVGDHAYLLVEKILVGEERLPAEWPIQGTTGYDFLGAVNNLFTNRAAARQFTDFYEGLTGDSRSPGRHLLAKKRFILLEHMGGELDNLCRLLTELAPQAEVGRLGVDTLRNAIAAFLIHCPVYRFYGQQMPLAGEELKKVDEVLVSARRAHPELEEGFALFRNLLTSEDEALQPGALDFYLRCMQLTGPLMAKGGEDTLMYTYDRFIGHNDVGDAVENFGLSVTDFHEWIAERQAAWPLTMNTTSTHDTKRGEDVRARLNVLTDLAPEWFALVRMWKRQNEPLRRELGAPDENDEYLIYQVLIGSMPFGGPDADDYPERLADYLSKALREGKINSDWAEPNEAYEKGVIDFVQHLLHDETFLQSFLPFYRKVADFGIRNSLGQLTVKMMAPGVPDLYQGCELWDFSLVDPDNRRPVNYADRADKLEVVAKSDWERLWKERDNGNVKLWLTQGLLKLRSEHPAMFSEGEYIALKTDGQFKDKILAFLRKYRNDVLLVVVPVSMADISDMAEQADWGDTVVILPVGMAESWTCALTGQGIKSGERCPVNDILNRGPVGIYHGIRETNRAAGLLLHVSSLPSRFGIGDLGPEAFRFADFLHGAGQKVWQMLPLNPIDKAHGYSPYSALSAFAGNPLLISPELLAGEKWLDPTDFPDVDTDDSWQVRYPDVTALKSGLLRKAWLRFQADQAAQTDFDAFCSEQSGWLTDYALYMAIRGSRDHAPWTSWPEELRNRDESAISRARQEYADEIRYHQWLQYVFFRQWDGLKHYCHFRNIHLMGDLPFYVSYDSADVWLNPALFKLDESGGLTGVAGVPPDAFSETGQLWGTPVYDWQVSEESGHAWWIERLRQNTEMFDFVRLDHFRAFYDFWEVPGTEQSAENGRWEKGPGKAFFDAVEAELGALPFVAEDLGDINAGTRQLRDELKLPGMKVLHFAFGKGAAETDHAPHHHERNYVVYAGTHDNNTTVGWFNGELDDEGRRLVSDYVGYPVTEENVAEVFGNLAYASVCDVAIIQVQDLLHLNEQSRMNFPGKSAGNWVWKLRRGQLDKRLESNLLRKTLRYDRI